MRKNQAQQYYHFLTNPSPIPVLYQVEFVGHCTMQQMREQVQMNPAEGFYKRVLELLNKSRIPYMVAGAYALAEYTGVRRQTKDFDIFCKASDFPKILNFFAKEGFETEITDERWIAKIYKNDNYTDFIFGTVGNVWRVDDMWFDNAPKRTIFGVKTKIVPAEEFIWTKLYMQERSKFEGGDVNHLILKVGNKLDWKRLLFRMETHWEILLAHIMNFRFVYPTERNIIPEWILKELLERTKQQLLLPMPQGKICRGGLLSRFQYITDYTEWGYTSEAEDASVDYVTQNSIKHNHKKGVKKK